MITKKSNLAAGSPGSTGEVNLKEQRGCVTELLKLVLTKPEGECGLSMLLRSTVGEQNAKLTLILQTSPRL